MCVLGVADKRRPTDDELEKMEMSNGDGGGIAWRERSSPKAEAPDIVKWEKGLTLAEMKEFCSRVPMPFAFHFRIASCGGKTKEMTHPFPIERDVRTALSGSIKGPVLFHNGHWSPWKDKGIDNAIHHRVKVPEGLWSDTRVMAWLTFLHGHRILDFIDEKVILFGPTKIEIFHPDGWFRVNDLLVSNRHWESVFPRGGNGRFTGMDDGSSWESYDVLCRYASCKKDKVGSSFYCEDHQPPCRYYLCNKPRVAGSENCAEHQPFCLEMGCSTPRVFGTKYCSTHLEALKEKSTASPVPFRSGAEVVQAGADHSKGSDDVQGKVGGVGEADVVPPILNDPIAQERRRWACSLNPKAIRTPGSVM